MATTWEQFKKKRPLDESTIRSLQKIVDAQVRAIRLREMREVSRMTQNQVAQALDISQKRVSEIERGDVERTQVDTLRRYVAALGGTLHIEVEVGDRRFPIA